MTQTTPATPPARRRGRPGVPTYAFDDAGTLVLSFSNRQQAAAHVGVPAPNIVAAVSSGGRAAGLRWRNTPTPLAPNAAPKGRCKPTYGFDDAGALVYRFDSRQEAAAHFGIAAPRVVAAALTGRRAAGLRWRDDAAAAPPARAPRLGRSLPVIARDAFGVVVGTYASGAQAAQAVGLSRAAINLAIRKGRRCRGLTWAYADPR